MRKCQGGKKIRGLARYYRRLEQPVPYGPRLEEWIEYLHRSGKGPDYPPEFYVTYETVADRFRFIADRPDLEAGYDFDHIHLDGGYWHFRWRAIRAHLDAMMRSFAGMEQACAGVQRPFQFWAHVGLNSDYGMLPTLYFHTPNIYCDYFPHTESGGLLLCPGDETARVEWPPLTCSREVAERLKAYLLELVGGGYTVAVWQVGPPCPVCEILIWREGFGQSLKSLNQS